MEKFILDNQRYNAVRMRNIVERPRFTKDAKPKTNERKPRSYDPMEREKELRDLEKMRSYFVSIASRHYHYPDHTKPKPSSLISRLLNLKALKQSVAGMIRSIIF